MYINRTSIIQKVLAKDSVITAFEAIYLKYLARKGILNDLMDVERASNPYLVARETRGPISSFMLDFIVRKVSEDDPDSYRKYNFAYTYIVNQDSNSEKLGYRGIALINQLRLMKLEYSQSMVVRSGISLENFESYSYLDQKQSSFIEILATLGETFKYFLMDIDNILTLNYYLNQIIKLEDLSCIQLLKMWLSQPLDADDREEFSRLNGAYLCCTKDNIECVLNDNHHNFAESLKRSISDLPVSFEEQSLEYVKQQVERIVS